jgi:hypothetical protein
MNVQIPGTHAGTKMYLSSLLAALCLCVLVGSSASVTMAGDWPTYRHDAARSGVGANDDSPLQGNPALRWTYVPLHPPDPAWPAPRDAPHARGQCLHVAVRKAGSFGRRP